MHAHVTASQEHEFMTDNSTPRGTAVDFRTAQLRYQPILNARTGQLAAVEVVPNSKVQVAAQIASSSRYLDSVAAEVESLRKYVNTSIDFCISLPKASFRDCAKNSLNSIRDRGIKLSLSAQSASEIDFATIMSTELSIIKFSEFLPESSTSHNPQKFAIDLVSLAKQLKLLCVVGNVCEREHLKGFLTLGFDFFQGDLFSPPLTRADLTAYLSHFE